MTPCVFVFQFMHNSSTLCSIKIRLATIFYFMIFFCIFKFKIKFKNIKTECAPSWGKKFFYILLINIKETNKTWGSYENLNLVKKGQFCRRVNITHIYTTSKIKWTDLKVNGALNSFIMFKLFHKIKQLKTFWS